MPEHDRNGRTCATCDFFQLYDGNWGMCRRRAPVVIADRSKDQRGHITTEARSVFPMIQTMDWCGEWERRDG